MEHRTWLVEGFCPAAQYNCLMPVEYEAVEDNGVVREYQKTGMLCKILSSGEGCPHEAECKHFAKAPAVLDRDVPWVRD